jgi:hypothetical protein
MWMDLKNQCSVHDSIPLCGDSVNQRDNRSKASAATAWWAKTRATALAHLGRVGQARRVPAGCCGPAMCRPWLSESELWPLRRRSKTPACGLDVRRPRSSTASAPPPSRRRVRASQPGARARNWPEASIEVARPAGPPGRGSRRDHRAAPLRGLRPAFRLGLACGAAAGECI